MTHNLIWHWSKLKRTRDWQKKKKITSVRKDKQKHIVWPLTHITALLYTSNSITIKYNIQELNCIYILSAWEVKVLLALTIWTEKNCYEIWLQKIAIRTAEKCQKGLLVFLGISLRWQAVTVRNTFPSKAVKVFSNQTKVPMIQSIETNQYIFENVISLGAMLDFYIEKAEQNNSTLTTSVQL